MATNKTSNREQIIKNVKTVGDIIMYTGSAGLMIPKINQARQNQNGVMGVCSMGAGAALSIGLGKIASNVFNKVVDSVVDFWDDVKPKKEEEDDESNKDRG